MRRTRRRFQTSCRASRQLLASLGPEDSGAREELEAALTRARAQSKPKPRVSMSPDVAIEEAKLKVTRLEEALEAMGIFQGPRWIVCRRHSPRPEMQHGTSIGGPKQRMPRIHQSGRASRREVGGKHSGRDDHVGGRASTIESIGADDGSSSSSPTKEQQINALVQERYAFRAAAIPTKKSNGPGTSTEFAKGIRRDDDTRCQTPCRTPCGGGYVSRGCTRLDSMVVRSTDVTEFGDLPSVGHLSRLISEGASKLQELGGPCRVTSMLSNMVP